MGNEGFLACTTASGALKWALFFNHSNPFYELEVLGEKLVAETSHDLRFTVDLHVPTNISVEPCSWH